MAGFPTLTFTFHFISRASLSHLSERLCSGVVQSCGIVHRIAIYADDLLLLCYKSNDSPICYYGITLKFCLFLP